MSWRANVVVVVHDRPAASSLVKALAAHCCSVFTVAPSEAPVEAVRARRPDVVILQATQPAAAALDIARALKADAATEHTPIILLTDASDRAPVADGLDAVVDDILLSRSSDTELYTHLQVLMRLNVMRSELARRAAIHQSYGLSREPFHVEPISTESVTILTAGDFARDLKTLVAAVGQARSLTFADTPQSAIDKLNAASFDAAVVSVDGAADEWLTMCGDIRDNPRLFHLPVLVLADPHNLLDPAALYEKGASDVLVRPLDEEVLRSRLMLLVKQHRYQRRMQETYHRARHLETGDSLTGLYCFGYLHDYLASLIADAELRAREFSVGFFDVDGMARINQRYGYAGGDVLLRQVASSIGRLVRGEDLTARYGGEEFCVVMPETSQEAAATALRRIAGVIGQTEFGVATAEGPVVIRLKVGCAGFDPRESGDSAESLIARARAAAR